MVDIVEGGPLTASRDRALILIGVRGGLRRSELAGIRCEHLQPHARGITITLPKSKTDQEGQGREVEIARGSQPETRRSPNVVPRQNSQLRLNQAIAASILEWVSM
jgi:integrase